MVRNKMLRLIILFISLFSLPAQAEVRWLLLKEGIEYAFLTPPKASAWSRIQAFRFDPSKIDLQLGLAQDHHKQSATVKEIAEAHDALLAINGGFFSPDYTPVGLRISDGIVRHPLKNISWWGIFFVQNQTPHIVSPSQFKSYSAIKLAVQSGPRLLVQGQIPKLKPGTAERTAVGITSRGKLIIAVTQHYPITTSAFAALLHNEFDCVDALNFDGGSSTQLYSRIGAFTLQLDGFSNIADALLVLPKK